MRIMIDVTVIKSFHKEDDLHWCLNFRMLSKHHNAAAATCSERFTIGFLIHAPAPLSTASGTLNTVSCHLTKSQNSRSSRRVANTNNAPAVSPRDEERYTVHTLKLLILY